MIEGAGLLPALTLTGTPAELRSRLEQLAAAGLTEIAYQPAGSDIPGELARFIEAVGFYDPITQPATVRIDDERARHWLSVGAQPTDTVRHLFVRAGILPAPEGSAQRAPATTAEATAAAE